MRKHLVVSSVLMLASVVGEVAQGAPNTLSAKEKADGWKLLWDGKTGTGWRSVHSQAFPDKGWVMKDGVLSVNETTGEEGGNAGDIVTLKRYKNFELEADFRMTRGANSGIKYFVDADMNKGKGSAIGYEYQILDDAVHPDGKKGKDGDRTLASLYDMIPAAKDKPTRAIGEWNTAKIVVRGNHVEHWLNGVKVVEYERGTAEFRALVAGSKYKVWPGFADWPDGVILLQDHGFPVDFRSVKIHELR
jgi:hypothetical protein